MQQAAVGVRTRAGRGMVGDLVVREALVPGAVVVAILLSNYAMAGLPNVKLFDLLVFVAGYTLGFRRGATVAVAAWLVYGQLNPWGATHSMLLATVMGSEVAYAAAGALAHRWLDPADVHLRPSAGMVVLAVAALVSTVLYDVATNVYTGYHWGAIAGAGEYARWIGIAVVGPGALLFMALHVGSNLVLFPVFGPPLIKAAHQAKVKLRWE